jgi:hypothetical protein
MRLWRSKADAGRIWAQKLAGATIKEIQEPAGHKMITMSARYSHLSPAHKLSVVERIAATAIANGH